MKKMKVDDSAAAQNLIFQTIAGSFFLFRAAARGIFNTMSENINEVMY